MNASPWTRVLLGLAGCAWAAAAPAGAATVAERLAEFGPAVRERLAPEFARVNVEYPPHRVTLVGLKSERVLEVWVSGRAGPWRLLTTYPILGQSGTLGPKLRQGDLQVPEGLYRISALNPNSRFHLSLRVDYPNRRDRARARQDGRRDLGGDIMIHGNTCSIGCLAMGDAAAEDLFVLAAETGLGRVDVILSPVDFRVRELPDEMPPGPTWRAALYEEIRAALAEFSAGS